MITETTCPACGVEIRLSILGGLDGGNGYAMATDPEGRERDNRAEAWDGVIEINCPVCNAEVDYKPGR